MFQLMGALENKNLSGKL